MPKANPGRRVGLARALSKLGYCSRTHAFALIREGKVRLNGTVHRNPEYPVHLDRDKISIAGRTLATADKIYILVNKPRNLVTTASDEKGRDTIYSLLPPDLQWVAPVGRLDKASEGLLLMTNDSEWAARITHPKSHLPKTYHVQIATLATDDLLARLAEGVRHEGELLQAREVRLLRTGAKNSWLEIVLTEGRNRHIRRMLATLEIEVLRLIRVGIGSLILGDLAKGQWRLLTAEEKRGLD